MTKIVYKKIEVSSVSKIFSFTIIVSCTATSNARFWYCVILLNNLQVSYRQRKDWKNGQCIAKNRMLKYLIYVDSDARTIKFSQCAYFLETNSVADPRIPWYQWHKNGWKRKKMSVNFEESILLSIKRNIILATVRKKLCKNCTGKFQWSLSPKYRYHGLVQVGRIMVTWTIKRSTLFNTEWKTFSAYDIISWWWLHKASKTTSYHSKFTSEEKETLNICATGIGSNLHKKKLEEQLKLRYQILNVWSNCACVFKLQYVDFIY